MFLKKNKKKNEHVDCQNLRWWFMFIFFTSRRYFLSRVIDGLPVLTICMLGNLACFCCRLLTFLKINFLQKNLSEEHYQSIKRFGSISGPTFFRS